MNGGSDTRQEDPQGGQSSAGGRLLEIRPHAEAGPVSRVAALEHAVPPVSLMRPAMAIDAIPAFDRNPPPCTVQHSPAATSASAAEKISMISARRRPWMTSAIGQRSGGNARGDALRRRDPVAERILEAP